MCICLRDAEDIQMSLCLRDAGDIQMSLSAELSEDPRGARKILMI